MKKITLSLLLLIFTTNIFSQDVEISKKFFTTENFRLAAILGYDLSWAGDNGKTALMSQNGSIESDKFSYNTKPNQTFFIGLDAYSPTSTLGFMGGLGINFQKYSIESFSGTTIDSIGTTNLEIPLYARLRLGKVRSNQFWLAVGGGYSINSKAEVIQKNSNGTIISTSSENKQFNSQPFLSGIVGYEILLGSAKSETYNRDTFRILLYAKANYDLGNRLDEDNIPSNSAIGSYSDPNIEFLRVSLGLKILLRLGKAGELIGNSLLENLN
ncbi:MAG: hypothetical protein Q8O88_02960 [bacterium]|nr:hypothetical protein [bacterium]